MLIIQNLLDHIFLSIKFRYPLYRRRRDNRYVVKNNIKLTNQWVVPHNLYLSTKYDAHINLEICNTIGAVKYLFKYVYKGNKLFRKITKLI
jgi:hypothetical protein